MVREPLCRDLVCSINVVRIGELRELNCPMELRFQFGVALFTACGTRSIFGFFIKQFFLSIKNISKLCLFIEKGSRIRIFRVKSRSSLQIQPDRMSLQIKKIDLEVVSTNGDYDKVDEPFLAQSFSLIFG